MLKKRSCAFLIALLLLFASSSHAENAAAYLSLYPTETDAETALQSCFQTAEALDPHSFDPCDPVQVAAFLDDCLSGSLREERDRLSLYANIRFCLDRTDATASALLAQLHLLSETINGKLLQGLDRLCKLPLTERQNLLSDDALSAYREDLAPLGNTTCTTGELTRGSIPMQYASELQTLTAEIEPPSVTAPDGSLLLLTPSAYSAVVSYETYDRDFRKNCCAVYQSRAAEVSDNAFSCLCAYRDELNDHARVSGKSVSTFLLDDACLDENAVLAEKDFVRCSLPQYHTYLDLRSKLLGVFDLQPFEMYTGVPDAEIHYSLEEALDLIQMVFASCGEDYLAAFDEMIASGSLVTFPEANAYPDALTLCVGREIPFVLVHFDGSTDSVFTLAHELTHACGYLLAAQNTTCDPQAPAVVQESAAFSTELLLAKVMLESAQSAEERLLIADTLLERLMSALFTQSMYADLADALLDPSGIATKEALSRTWLALLAEYRAGHLAFSEDNCQWAELPVLAQGLLCRSYAVAALGALSASDATDIARLPALGEEAAFSLSDIDTEKAATQLDELLLVYAKAVAALQN